MIQGVVVTLASVLTGADKRTHWPGFLESLGRTPGVQLSQQLLGGGRGFLDTRKASCVVKFLSTARFAFKLSHFFPFTDVTRRDSLPCENTIFSSCLWVTIKKKKKKPALEQRSARGVWPKCKAAGQFAGRHCFSREGAERGAFQHLFRHFFKRWFKFEAMGPNAEPLTPIQDLMNHTLDRHCSPPATSLGGHGGVVFCFSCPHKNSFSSTDHVLVSGGQGTSLYLWHGEGIQQNLRTQVHASSPCVWVAQRKGNGPWET